MPTKPQKKNKKQINGENRPAERFNNSLSFFGFFLPTLRSFRLSMEFRRNAPNRYEKSNRISRIERTNEASEWTTEQKNTLILICTKYIHRINKIDDQYAVKGIQIWATHCDCIAAMRCCIYALHCVGLRDCIKISSSLPFECRLCRIRFHMHSAFVLFACILTMRIFRR